MDAIFFASLERVNNDFLHYRVEYDTHNNVENC